MKFSVNLVCSNSIVILILSFSLSAHSALVARDLDGNLANGHEAVYDDVLNITWLADANLAASSAFGVTAGIANDGRMASWGIAQSWVNSMNAASYYGFDAWRLPTMNVFSSGLCDSNSHNAGADCGYNSLTYDVSSNAVFSEFSYMYYSSFEALAFRNADGSSNSSNIIGIENAQDPSNYLNLFNNVQSFLYWSGVQLALDNNLVWFFSFSDGFQDFAFKDAAGHVWVVHDGDIGVATVPVPAALWLFGSALLSLAGFKRQ